jgi:hypothetical protein
MADIRWDRLRGSDAIIGTTRRHRHSPLANHHALLIALAVIAVALATLLGWQP